MMMGGFGYSWPAMLMMGVGMLLVLVLIVVLIWALVRWLTRQQTPVTVTRPAYQAHDFSQEYEQGYQPQWDPLQRSEETTVAHDYRQQPQYEQPQVGYPQEMLPPQ
jgi:hypothetical protein